MMKMLLILKMELWKICWENLFQFSNCVFSFFLVEHTFNVLEMFENKIASKWIVEDKNLIKVYVNYQDSLQNLVSQNESRMNFNRNPSPT